MSSSSKEEIRLLSCVAPICVLKPPMIITIPLYPKVIASPCKSVKGQVYLALAFLKVGLLVQNIGTYNIEILHIIYCLNQNVSLFSL